MADLRFTVRNQAGEIVHRDTYRGNEQLTWAGPKRTEVMAAMRELPKYTRGKLKADIMHREIPLKELGSYQTEGVELVLSEKAFHIIITGDHWTEWGYDDGMTYDCYPIGDGVPFAYLRVKSDKWSAMALWQLANRELSQNIRHCHSIDDLEEAAKLYEWLKAFRDETTKFKIRLEAGSMERIYLYMQPDGLEEKRICELDHEQKAILGRRSGSEIVHLVDPIGELIENCRRHQKKLIKEVD